MPEPIADVKSEGQSLEIDKSFERLADNKEDKTSPESQPEKKETVKEPTQKGEPKAEKLKDNASDDKTPFHKHPRWIKTQETLKDYEKRLADYETKMKEFEKKNVSEVLPDWWKSKYGETPESRKGYSDYVVATQAERDRIKDEIRNELKTDSEKQSNSQKEADEYVNVQMAEMRDEGLDFERNELLKFMVDFQKEFGPGSLLDDKGNYDFRKSLALMQKMSPKAPDASIEAKKKIGADVMRSKVRTPVNTSVPSISRKALRGSWRDADL